MTKKELVKIIISLEYTEEQRTNWLVKARTTDLMKYRKAFLEARVEYLTNK